MARRKSKPSAPKRAFMFLTNGAMDRTVPIGELTEELFNQDTPNARKMTLRAISSIAKYCEERKVGLFCRIFDGPKNSIVAVRLASQNTPRTEAATVARIAAENLYKRQRSMVGKARVLKRGFANAKEHALLPSSDVRRIEGNKKPLVIEEEERREAELKNLFNRVK